MKNAIDRAATCETVAENLVRLRKARGLSVRALSAAMTKAGRKLSPSGITAIELGRRRVDVDDLMGFAVVLGVSPASLLLPLTLSGDELVEVTGAGTVSAAAAWQWATGQAPIDQGQTGRAAYEARMTYNLYGRPHWLNGGDS